MRLTRGEGWWLLRRQMQMRQSEMATLQAISEDRYRRWELDREPAPMPAILAAPMTPGQWCRVQRRRRGWSLIKAASRIGVSRVTLSKAERDLTRGVSRVRAYYMQIGNARPTAPTPVKVDLHWSAP